ncbi:hypothetical protein [Halogeometricum luteum]|uniref:Abortive infection C-terminus n=1 Tax=Halogeometricum luteum TaxID=2950537 RepID=A0ABU2FZ52_9EURY|nr:hypothetical protein [Halogeometricum sp. S3BR5-2]MDS0293359.1 hypothetical protein [Halogeometricum sp. S3BR5-2]
MGKVPNIPYIDDLERAKNHPQNNASDEDIDSLIEQISELKDTDGWEVDRIIGDLDKLRYMVTANYEDLEEALSDFKNSNESITSDQSKRLAWDVVRYLINFVAVTKALSEHLVGGNMNMRNQEPLLCQLEKLESGSGIISDFEAKEENLELHYYRSFFNNLRDIYLHEAYLPPRSKHTFQLHPEDTPEKDVIIKRDRLQPENQNWWDSPSQYYLYNIQRSDMSISDSCANYHELLVELLDWLSTEIRNRFQTELNELTNQGESIEQRHKHLDLP